MGHPAHLACSSLVPDEQALGIQCKDHTGRFYYITSIRYLQLLTRYMYNQFALNFRESGSSMIRNNRKCDTERKILFASHTTRVILH